MIVSSSEVEQNNFEYTSVRMNFGFVNRERKQWKNVKKYCATRKMFYCSLRCHKQNVEARAPHEMYKTR